MNQISTDGGLLKTVNQPTRIPMAPAERVDVVIDFAKYKVGDVVTLLNDDTFAPPIPEIMQFRVTHDEADTSSLPFNLNPSFVTYTESSPPLNPTPAPSPSPAPGCVNSNRCLTFNYDNGTGQWFINGQTYNSSAIEFPDIKLGNVEIWSLINSDTSHPIPHPFHEHLVEFQIIDVCPVAMPGCGTKPPASQQGWKDTVLVPNNQIVRIKMKFYYSGPDAFNAGNYVFHCHNLEHEDHAMMLQQTVSP
jgi:FtsP/CotA-like multicopper oxidase with cupredoxin domain